MPNRQDDPAAELDPDLVGHNDGSTVAPELLRCGSEAINKDRWHRIASPGDVESSR